MANGKSDKWLYTGTGEPVLGVNRKDDTSRKKERYQALLEMQENGTIRNLEQNKKFILFDGTHRKTDGETEREVSFKADIYYEKKVRRSWKPVIEDVDAHRATNRTHGVYMLKRKWVLQRYGIEVQEV